MIDFDFDFDSLPEAAKLLIWILVGIVSVAIAFALFVGPIILSFYFASMKPLLLYIITVGICVGIYLYNDW